MRRLIAVVGIVAVSGCTPAELDAWVGWYEQDPVAATEFANRPDIQEELHRPPTSHQSAGSWSVNWDAVARCESGGNWSMHVHNRYGWFGGGLAIMDSVWRNFGGREFAEHAGLATKAQQIVVAERIVDEVGFGQAWQCDDR